MSENLSIVVEKREVGTSENRVTESEGLVLGTLYGHGVEPVAISMEASSVLRLYRKSGKSKLINLTLDGKTSVVILKEMTLHPVRHQIQHVDFFAVDEKRKVTVPVPFKFTGVSPAVKNYGGVVTASHNSVRIQCLPKQIPDFIEVDLTPTKEIGSMIKLSDLTIAPELTVRKMDQGAIICSITGRKPKVVAVVEDKKKKKK